MNNFSQEKKLYVAHIDILGMSSLLLRSNIDAWLVLQDLAEAKIIKELPLLESSRNNLLERFFSDTIIIRSENDSIESLHTIIVRALELFRCAFRSSIPLRGGIVYGSWFESKSEGQELFTGDALVRAFNIGESQQLIGITVCDVIRQRFLDEPFTLTSGLPVIKDYLTPIKGCILHNRSFLNWPALCGQELQNMIPLSAKILANHFSIFGRYESLDDSVKTKYSNTINFIKHD